MTPTLASSAVIPEQTDLTTREALLRYLERSGLRKQGASRRDPYSDRWVRVRLAGRWIPVWPAPPSIWRSILLHDLHHLVTGYGTDLKGEFAVAAWELASGGCGWHLYLWPDRISVASFGLLFAPMSTWRAFRRGMRQHNLFRRLPPRSSLEPLLAMVFSDLCRMITEPEAADSLTRSPPTFRPLKT